MRNNYFDFNRWSRESIEPREWEPGERPGPYGEVPGVEGFAPKAAEAQSGPAAKGLRGKKTPAERRRRRERSEQRDGVGGFFFLLAMVLIVTCVGLYFQGGLPSLSIEGDWQPWGEWRGWDRYDGGYYDYYEEPDWTEELKDTAIERAETGGEFALELAPLGETELSPQEIYRLVGPSVVGVRSFAGEGIYLGTGIVLSSDGYIITNAHVIAGGKRADVVFSDNSKAKARLVGYDRGTDLAVLKIDRTGLPAATFGDSDQLLVGDPAYAIGNPLGEELWGTMTDGIISALDRAVNVDGRSMTLLQTTAALNSGNSGGALINAQGQVVGITNMKMMSEWETIEGLGFAVPSVLAKEVADQIVATGSYLGRPALGVTVEDHFDVSGEPDGARVRSVKKGSGAYGTLYTGDIILQAGDRPVTCTQDLLEARDLLGAGEELRLQIRTGGKEERLLEVSIPLGYSNAILDSEDSYETRK